MASSKCLPTTIIPIGSPSLKPALTDNAGWPVTSKGLVFCTPVPEALMQSALKMYSTCIIVYSDLSCSTIKTTTGLLKAGDISPLKVASVANLFLYINITFTC